MDIHSVEPCASSELPSPSERRSNVELREILDELLALVRRLARGADALPPHELAYSQQRLEWLADEVWRTVIHPPETHPPRS